MDFDDGKMSIEESRFIAYGTMFFALIIILSSGVLLACERPRPEVTGLLASVDPNNNIVIMKSCSAESNIEYNDQGRMIHCETKNVKCRGEEFFVGRALHGILGPMVGKTVTLSDLEGGRYRSYLVEGPKEDPCAEKIARENSSGQIYWSNGSSTLEMR